MPKDLTRRQFLRSAGGITFLALTPIGRGVFAATGAAANAALPLFTATPYLQPGDSSRLVEGAESVVIAWQTEAIAADFRMTYQGKGGVQAATLTRTVRNSEDGQRFNYAAHLGGLPLGTKVPYRVTGNGQMVAEGFFTTRQPRGKSVRFVALGDNACEHVGNRNVAYQAYLAHPDFFINAGDSVYDRGRDVDYAKNFFPVFNSDTAAAGVGAPILRSVPYYSVMGNHDVHHVDRTLGYEVADFDADPGTLAYFTNMYLPRNGPEAPASPPPIQGAADRLAAFQAGAGWRYPRMANYSFDCGDAHFTCLDSNLHVDPTDAGLQAWVKADLTGTDARWKFVTYHHPAFNVGHEHYHEQQMRVLAPLLESCGVDVVFSGHEHIYQRSRPLGFAPNGPGNAADKHHGNRMVPGTFTVDLDFDGVAQTKPKGVIYITTGAGGQGLYDPAMNANPSSWRHAEDGNAEYVANLVSDRHSFTAVDVDAESLTLRQVDENGGVIESIRVTKA